MFTAPDGTGLIPQSVSEAFARLVTAYGMPALTFHGLRHTCASVLLAAGLPMPVASRMLGHSSIGITVDTYGHVVMDVTTRDAVTVRWQGSRLVGVRSLARTLASGVCRRSWKGARDHHRR